MGDSLHFGFRIAEWHVRPQLNELEDADCQSTRIEPRFMSVLVCLAEAWPRVVTKDQILEAVWSSVHVGEDAVSQAIYQLRSRLGDEARQPRFIETIPRRGYRLLVEPKTSVDETAPRVGATLDDYEILRVCGQGGMGVIYEARDLKLGRSVALKFMLPELVANPAARRRFKEEAKLAGSLQHPNIATIHDIRETSHGWLFIVTPLYEGGSLRERLRGKAVPLEEAIRIACQVGEGLAEAHRNGIVHRDIAPGNILFTSSGTAAIADFGIAKLLGSTRHTRTGVSLGTPAYKSPEQSRGGEVDHRTDLWSLGTVLFEMVTGTHPFEAEYERAVIHGILEHDPLRDSVSPEVPVELRSVIRRALEKRPEDRFQTARELVDDLQRIDVEEARPTEASRFKKWKLLVGALLLAVVAVLWAASQSEIPVESEAIVGSVSSEVERFLTEGRAAENNGASKANLDQAEECYRRAVALAPRHPRALAHLADFLTARYAQEAEAGGLEEIDLLVERALSLEPELSLAWVARSRLLLLRKQQQEAEDAARRAVELSSDGWSLSALGEAIYSQEGRQEEGLELLQRGTRASKGYIRAMVIYARKLLDRGQSAQAAEQYRRILRYNKFHTTASANLAIIQSQQTQQQFEAKRRLEGILADYGPTPTVLNNLGAVLFKLGRYKEALTRFEEAWALDSSLCFVAHGIADTFQALGEDQRAHEWYEVALDRYTRTLAENPHQSRRIAQRAVVMARLGAFELALREIERALAQFPMDSRHYFDQARVRILARDHEGAIQAVRHAVESGVSPEEIRHHPLFSALVENEDVRFFEALESMPKR